MFNNRNLTLAIGSLILGSAVLIGVGPAKSDVIEAERSRGQRVVQVGKVELTGATRVVRLPGITRSVERASLAFTIPARLASRNVEVGDRVKAGQTIASLDAREYELAGRSAEAVLAELDVRLDQAGRDEARVEKLASAKAATAEELEKVRAATATIRAAREAAAARVADTKRLLEETILRAPFEGTVSKTNLEAGEWASPGKTVVELSGSRGVEVRVEVAESMLRGVEPGAKLEIDLPMSGRKVGATVTSVSDQAAGAGALFPVIVTIDRTEDVVAGMTAEVILPLNSASELSVPIAAVLDAGSDRAAVFRIESGVAHRVAITPGRVVANRLTVRADDLEDGDLVAVVGHTALVDGDKVEVR